MPVFTKKNLPIETIIKHDGISFILVRSHVKNINLRITHKGIVRISAPFKTDIKTILDFVSKKKSWILCHTAKITAEDGCFLYLGKQLPLEQLENKELAEFYEQKAYKILPQRYCNICEVLSIIDRPSLHIKPMRGKYGYYNKANHEIYLNSGLIIVQPECIDYVIVHELMHTLYFNHGKEFHQAVKAIVPNEKQLRNTLAKYILW